MAYWGLVVIGPTWVSLLAGSPMRAVEAKATSLSVKASWMESWTSRRDPAMQVWPVAAKMPDTAPLTAPSMSASSKTMLGDLPPSSSVTGFRPLAAAS